MPKLLIVTYIDFWRMSAGHRSRLTSLINYFRDKVSITIVYTGAFNDEDSKIIKHHFPEITMDVLSNQGITYKEFEERFEMYIRDKKYHFALIEYIEMSFVLPYLDSKCITLLDTHDLVANRIESFKENKLPYDGMQLTAEEELGIFKCFDYIIAIQKTDYISLTKEIEVDRLLLVPHPSNFSKKELRQEVSHVGFVASGYLPNVDGINWFLENVWPVLSLEFAITLNIYGHVCQGISKSLAEKYKSVLLHGFIDELSDVYANCDVMINPVKCGAGLKIKNIEAMGNGLPLITTSHGSLGIEDGINKSFIAADTPEAFISSLKRLILRYDFRKMIAENAYAYAKGHFTERKCYQPLTEIFLGH